MYHISEVRVEKLAGDKTFYLLEKEGDFIHTLYQTKAEAEQAIDKNVSAYAVVMGQGEVISYGKSVGFISEKVNRTCYGN